MHLVPCRRRLGVHVYQLPRWSSRSILEVVLDAKHLLEGLEVVIERGLSLLISTAHRHEDGRPYVLCYVLGYPERNVSELVDRTKDRVRLGVNCVHDILRSESAHAAQTQGRCRHAPC